MAKREPLRFYLRYPGDLEYIPAIRKYVSDILLANNFDSRFAYRSEVIIDEICTNAVNFGCRSIDASVELTCTLDDKHVEFVIRDEGGSKDNIEKLRLAVKEKVRKAKGAGTQELATDKRLGLEIVRLISDEVTFEIDRDNLTSVRVVKKREDEHVSEMAGEVAAA